MGKGVLNPCFETWSRQGQGFVCISEKSGDIWKDRMFKWPQDKDKIESLVEGKLEQETNLYWAPLVFKTKRRDETQVKPGNTLYADLDPVDPKGLTIKPTLAWESSPGRFQALWWIDESLDPKELANMNRALTYHVNADPGGWDLTQVLRIPGTYNYKYNPPTKGKLLWFDQKIVYNRKKFDKIPQPEITNQSSGSSTITLVELLSKYRKVIPSKVSKLLQYPESRVEAGKRSDMLWYIESELVKAQIPLEDIVQLVGLSAWNKYRGRNDEWKRLTTEISKVYDEFLSSTEPISPKREKDDDEEPKGLPWQSFGDLMGSSRSRPGFLIKDIWLKRSHGMVAGEPKTFKSTVALDIAVSVASGKPLWGQFPVEDQGPVLIIQNENSEWIIKDRMEKIIYSKDLVGIAHCKNRILTVDFPPNLPIYFLNNFGYTFSDPLHREELEDTMEELNPRLVILDPLYLMFDGEINSAKELNPILTWLMELKNDYNTSIMVIHHWNKGGTSTRGGQRMLGSTTLHGWVESALYIQSQAEEDTLNGPVPKIVIERELRGGGVLPKIALEIKMGDMGDPTYEAKLTEVKGSSGPIELLDLLTMYPQGLSTSQAAKELNVSRRRISDLMERIKDKIKIISGPRNSTVIKLNEEERLNDGNNRK